jgi:hypothetical protein
MKKTKKRAAPRVGLKSTGEPQWSKDTAWLHKPVRADISNLDLPHLRNGGGWNEKSGLPEARTHYYLGCLRALGMCKIEAECVINDLYWDCYMELAASGRPLEQFSANWHPPQPRKLPPPPRRQPMAEVVR